MRCLLLAQARGIKEVPHGKTAACYVALLSLKAPPEKRMRFHFVSDKDHRKVVKRSVKPTLCPMLPSPELDPNETLASDGGAQASGHNACASEQSFSSPTDSSCSRSIDESSCCSTDSIHSICIWGAVVFITIVVVTACADIVLVGNNTRQQY